MRWVSEHNYMHKVPQDSSETCDNRHIACCARNKNSQPAHSSFPQHVMAQIHRQPSVWSCVHLWQSQSSTNYVTRGHTHRIRRKIANDEALGNKRGHMLHGLIAESKSCATRIPKLNRRHSGSSVWQIVALAERRVSRNVAHDVVLMQLTSSLGILQKAREYLKELSVR
jgi:hypothetical protein